MEKNEFEKIKPKKEIKESEKLFDNYMYNAGVKFINGEITAQQCDDVFKDICQFRMPAPIDYDIYRKYEDLERKVKYDEEKKLEKEKFKKGDKVIGNHLSSGHTINRTDIENWVGTVEEILVDGDIKVRGEDGQIFSVDPKKFDLFGEEFEGKRVFEEKQKIAKRIEEEFREDHGYQQYKENKEEWEKSASLFYRFRLRYFLKKQYSESHMLKFETIMEELREELKGKKILEIGPAGTGGVIKALKDFFKDDIEATAVEEGRFMIFYGEKCSIDSSDDAVHVFKESDIDLILLEDYDYDKKRIAEVLSQKGPFDIIISESVFYDGDGGSIDKKESEADKWFEFYNLFLRKGGMFIGDSPQKYDCCEDDPKARIEGNPFSGTVFKAEKFDVEVEVGEVKEKYKLAGIRGDVFIKY